MTDLRDEAATAFQEIFGRASDGLWSAPGRVNLIGEHTDYNEGFVLPFAIDRRTIAALAVRDDRMLRIASAFTDELVEHDLTQVSPDVLHGWSAYPFGVAWALGEHGADLHAVPGADIYIDSDVPVGAGLSSSAAIECAVAIALDDVWHLGLDRAVLARAGQLAENTAVGAPTGIMDQAASLFGEDGAAVFLDCRSLESRLVDLRLAEAGLAIVVIDTGAAHDLATGGYGERRASCERAAKALGVAALRDVRVDDLDRARGLLDDTTFRRLRHVVTENQRVLDVVRLLATDGPASIGELLDASHRSLRNDFDVSTPQLDLAVETAVGNGAIGARMTGGGFGGAAIALVPEELTSLLRVAIDGAFAEHGLEQPDIFRVAASIGARRDA
ncbi:galactokinase [Cryobacterium mesophilum]|uniref:galactokinase n=1 Tax=Terrimesophilobacter mesophilus TaxID=433647 RepID=UPI00184575B8|nr:galactokinase [Terrimesophilobacter mesophilus]MBB5632810.1 galactokinase [Terrimesophilobacter mesophilus]